MRIERISGLSAGAAPFVASFAWAEPEVSLAPGQVAAPNAVLAGAIDDLDRARRCWVTIVPATAESGAFGEFHHVGAAARAELSFGGLAADRQEVRLHGRGGGDPILARLAVALGTPPPAAAEPSEATRALAAAYGLNGDWVGCYTGPDGAADVGLTLWMERDPPGDGGRPRADPAQPLPLHRAGREGVVRERACLRPRPGRGRRRGAAGKWATSA